MALTDNHKYLNNRGLETLWGKIESLVQSAVATLTTMINGKQDSITVTTSTSTPADNDTVIMQASGTTDTTTFLRRTMSKIWDYVKSKADGTYMLKNFGGSTPNMQTGTGGAQMTSVTRNASVMLRDFCVTTASRNALENADRKSEFTITTTNVPSSVSLFDGALSGWNSPAYDTVTPSNPTVVQIVYNKSGNWTATDVNYLAILAHRDYVRKASFKVEIYYNNTWYEVATYTEVNLPFCCPLFNAAIKEATGVTTNYVYLRGIRVTFTYASNNYWLSEIELRSKTSGARANQSVGALSTRGDSVYGKLNLMHDSGVVSDGETGAVNGDTVYQALLNKQDKLTLPLPISNGGTGAADVKSARMNLLSDATVAETDVSDSNYFAFRYATPSGDNGAIYYKGASKVWNYIKSKADSVYQPIITAGTGLSKSGNTINHSNSVTARTSYLGDADTIPRVKVDEQGHITAYTTSEPSIRQRTNKSGTSTNATLYHKLMTVKVAKGPSHQSGILEIFAGGASTPGYYYARIYYNIRNSAGSSATTCSHSKKAFKIVDGFCTENADRPKAENFTYGWKNNAGDMDLVFYFKTTGTYNSFTYRFFFAHGSTIGTTYNSSSDTARDSSYTYESCEAASTVECLTNALSARNDEDGNRIKTNYLKLSGGTVTGVTTIAGVVSTSSVHASPLVVNTANSSVPHINFATGSFGNETVVNQLMVRSEVSPNITAEGGAIYSTKYGWLGNYANNTYTVSDIDGLCGMTGTGTLILPQLTSNYSIGRYFWVAPSGGSVIVSYTTQNRGTVTEAIAASSGALFVCCSSGYWAKVGGDESQSIFNCSTSQTLSSSFAYDFVNVTANNLTITLPDPSTYTGASKIRILINFSVTADFTASITVKGKFGASGTTQTLAYDHLMMGSLLTFTHIRQLGRWFYNNSTY